MKTVEARRYDIDWLRIIAVYLLFIYHPARIFYLWGGWYIESSQKIAVVSYIAMFIEHWQMPLLFFLAGASTFFALGIRGAGRYVVERLRRLLVPFVFGLAVLVPPQIYLMLLFNGRLSTSTVSYWQFYPDYFSGRFTGGFDMGHLWFIFYLFFFSLAALPVFFLLRRRAGEGFLEKLSRIFAKPGMIFLPVILIALAKYAMLDFYPNPVYYLAYFVLGYVLTANRRFVQAVEQHRLAALILGLGLFVLRISLVRLEIIDMNWLRPIPMSLITWCCLIAAAGYGSRYLSAKAPDRLSGRLLRYAGKSSYPVYLLHQTVIVVLAFWIVRWNAPAWLRYAVVVLASLIITVILYDVAVRRAKPTRFLFGMKPRTKDKAAA